MQITLFYEHRRYGNEWPVKSYKATVQPGGIRNERLAVDVRLMDLYAKGFATDGSSEVMGFNLLLDRDDAKKLALGILGALEITDGRPVVMLFGDATE